MRFFITLFLLNVAAVSFGQVHFGLNTAINSTFVLDKGLSEDPRYNSTFTYEFAPIGFSFGVDITKGFGLQLESIIANQGQIYEVINAANEVVGERNIDLRYIQLPLFMKFMSNKDKAARTNFSIGPQLSILSSGVETLDYQAALMEISAEYVSDNGDGTFTVVDPSTGEVLDPAATAGSEPDTYNVSAVSGRELLKDEAENKLNEFKE
ncbi:MAG: outer membrane beta-barrel protein, partial [Fulvivirga sp.]|nr:outer membrane beta-barrel protein [Fulvivirga sp.]